MIQEKLPPPLPSDDSSKRSCPVCGKPIELSWKHCGFCGSELRSPLPTPQIPNQTREPAAYDTPIRRTPGKPVNTSSKKPGLILLSIISSLIALTAIILLVVTLTKNRQTAAGTIETATNDSSTVSVVESTAFFTQTNTYTPDATSTSTITNTPLPTETPEPTATPLPKGIPATVVNPTSWECRRGPGENIYGYDGWLEDEHVKVIGMNSANTWYKAIGDSNGQICWIPYNAVDKTTFSKLGVPVVDDPPTDSPIYYGYRYGICSTGWTVSSANFILCSRKPSCQLTYPEKSSARETAEEALNDCKQLGGNSIYCINAIPYTLDAVNAGTTGYTCNIPRVDHSETDINYIVYWVRIP